MLQLLLLENIRKCTTSANWIFIPGGTWNVYSMIFEALTLVMRYCFNPDGELIAFAFVSTCSRLLHFKIKPLSHPSSFPVMFGNKMQVSCFSCASSAASRLVNKNIQRATLWSAGGILGLLSYVVFCLFRVGPDFDWSSIGSAENTNEMMSVQLGGGCPAGTVMVHCCWSEPGWAWRSSLTCRAWNHIDQVIQRRRRPRVLGKGKVGPWLHGHGQCQCDEILLLCCRARGLSVTFWQGCSRSHKTRIIRIPGICKSQNPCSRGCGILHGVVL